MTHTLPLFVLRRLAGALAFVVVVSSTALLLIRLAPGDASTEMRIRVADTSVITSEQARLGLDRSPLAQLGSWLAGLARLDLGTSSRFGRPVSGLVAERVGNTAMLAGLALVIATVLGIPLGVVSGPTSGHARAAAASGVPAAARAMVWFVLLVACPPILFALALLYFSVETGGRVSRPGADAAAGLALPMADSRTIDHGGGARHGAGRCRGARAAIAIDLRTHAPVPAAVLGVYGIIMRHVQRSGRREGSRRAGPPI